MSADLPSLEALLAMGPVRTAAFWLERLQHEEEAEDNALFVAWLAHDTANGEAWDEALDLWDSFDLAGDTVAQDEALQAMRREALTLRPRRPRMWLAYAAAASVALVAAGAAALHLAAPGPAPAPRIALADNHPDPQRFGAPDYTTRTGQQTTVTLSDGSRLTLDTDSAVDVAFAGDQRLVRLVRGQVFFDVAHNAGRPFRVAAGQRIVSVLGTRFNVRFSPQETSVLLEKGAVAISMGSDPARPGPALEHLVPGQQLLARAGQPDRIDKVALGARLDWREGFLQFDDSTLAQAVAELNRYSGRKLVVRDPQLAGLRISGGFPTGDPDRFVQTLMALYPVRVVAMADGGVEIVARR